MNFSQNLSDQQVIDDLRSAIEQARLLALHRAPRKPPNIVLVLRQVQLVLTGAHTERPIISTWENFPDMDPLIKCADTTSSVAKLKAWERRERSLTLQQRFLRFLGHKVYPLPVEYTVFRVVHKISIKPVD